MAHASGTYDLIDINSYEPEKDNIISIIKNCSSLFNENLLINYYVECLIKWINDNTMDHEDLEFFIDEYLIVTISVSPVQLKFISELSRNKIYKAMDSLKIEDKNKSQLYNFHLKLSNVLKEKYLLNLFEN